MDEQPYQADCRLVAELVFMSGKLVVPPAFAMLSKLLQPNQVAPKFVTDAVFSRGKLRRLLHPAHAAYILVAALVLISGKFVKDEQFCHA